ncbi:PAS domain-containing protein [Mucilaginibacter jinjuensis]|uniref:PAS domain-containing protein n=1 Tax=Mucilaginibacter jinjuensis TaxID=1176721 RepID=A0ABY7TAN0_9SPHI|nr:PAS domain-containing protein [Mucilaginibacter jinjuensis]WCT13368.1 PAS domain-containing protein [Mucilaginibacter jinjuensis]
MKPSNDLSYILNNSDGFNPELLTLALNSSVVSVLVTDNRLYDNPIIYCNKAFENVTGYNREEVIGLNCRFLQGQQRDLENVIAIRRGLREGTDVEVVIRNFKKDGTAFYNELHISPVRNSSGAITHFIGIQLDVTNRERNIQETGCKTPVQKEKRLKGFLSVLRLLLPFK